MSTSTTEKYEFQAEVKEVLDIVVNSLYTDKEIFIRELISNASDALEKLRHTQLTEANVHDDKLELEINVHTDEENGTITIQDFGIGMTKEEMIENIGTIAHSGSKAFLNALKEKGDKNENLIGKFGVGFYSAFMVAQEVKVYSRTWRTEGTSYCWTSEGIGSYEIEECPSEENRGAKIVMKLKEEHKDFSKADDVKRIIKEYSSFVPFPVKLNGEKINTVEALWLKNKSEIKDEDYKEFYKFQANAWDEPMFWLHFNTDAPIEINSLLFCPSENMEKMGMGQMDSEVSLFCRKVLIDSKPKNLLPDWLRFLKGVVDSADLPLNISRETMQDSQLVQKLNKVITKKFLKHCESIAKKDPEKYESFWSKFGVFFKEGVSTDFTHREQLTKLLRFESSHTEAGKLTSLEDYISRKKEEQKEIYYISGTSRDAIESGPYMEAFKARSLEVLYLTEVVDEYVMNHVREFKELKLVSIDQDDIKLEDAPDLSGEDKIDDKEFENLGNWMKETLGEQVTEVKTNDRLVDSPAMIVNADDGMTAQMKKIMQQMGQGMAMPDQGLKLALNPRHGLVKKLLATKSENEDLAKLMAAQILDSAKAAAGLLEDPNEMVKRMYQLMEKI